MRYTTHYEHMDTLRVGLLCEGLNLLGSSALLVEELVFLVMLLLLTSGGTVSQVCHLLLLHALTPCTVQLQNLHQTTLFSSQ